MELLRWFYSETTFTNLDAVMILCIWLWTLMILIRGK